MLQWVKLYTPHFVWAWGVPLEYFSWSEVAGLRTGASVILIDIVKLLSLWDLSLTLSLPIDESVSIPASRGRWQTLDAASWGTKCHRSFNFDFPYVDKGQVSSHTSWKWFVLIFLWSVDSYPFSRFIRFLSFSFFTSSLLSGRFFICLWFEMSLSSKMILCSQLYQYFIVF